MKLGLMSLGKHNGGYSRRLGAAPDASVLLVTPDSVPPGKVATIPLSTEDANAARISYNISAKALGGEVEWLGRLRPANWDETLIGVVGHSKIQYDALVKSVRGRTGNPDAEYELELQWWGLWDRAYQAYKNPPSWLTQAADKVSVFLSDFTKGAQQAWQDYSDWAVRNSGPVLGKYHDSLSHVAMLESDLEAAKASGNYSAGEIFDQEQAVVRATEALQTVRDVYNVVSAGGDIDRLAVETFGPYSLSAIVLTPVMGVLIASITASIIWAAAAVFLVQPLSKGVGDTAAAIARSIEKIAKESPVYLIVSIGLVGAMLVLPFALFGSKKEIKVLTAPQPEAR